MIRIRPFKEKEKEGGEGKSQLNGQWKVPMFSGPYKIRPNAWWPLKGSNVWWPMEGEGEAPFHLFPLSHQEILLKPSFFRLILRFYFSMVLGRYLRISFLFLNL
jgi:hypothetical protein